MKSEQEIISCAAGFVRESVSGHDSGHGWLHIVRVVNLALLIHRHEGKGDRLIIELGALMHDVGDHKFSLCDGPAEIRRVLSEAGADPEIIEEIVMINQQISFSRGEPAGEKSIGMRIVQDADRLDAMGAIGIARAFNYGGWKGNEIYNPGEQVVIPEYSRGGVAELYEKYTGAAIPPERRLSGPSTGSHKHSSTPRNGATGEARNRHVLSTINHFFEKLLVLRELMNTETGKRMAEERHKFMLRYLEQFFSEWNEANGL